jgi:hypothetical protein
MLYYYIKLDSYLEVDMHFAKSNQIDILNV